MSLSLLVAGLLSITEAPTTWDAWLESPRIVGLADARSPATLELLNHAWVTAIEPRRGVPSFLWAERFPGTRSPADQGLTSREAARMHLLRFARVYRLDAATVARLVVSEVHELGGRGAVIVGFAREREGVPFLRDEIDVVMTPKYELVALTGSLATTEPHEAFRLGAPAALSVAAQYLSGVMLDPGAMTLVKASGGGWAKFTADGSPFRSHPRARKVYFDDADAVRPAWHLEVETAQALYAMVVSATDGRVLCITSLRTDASHTYRVFADPLSPNRASDSPVGNAALPHLTGLPDGFTPPILDAGTVTLDHAGISTMDSWLPSGATALSGNNVNAVVSVDRDGGTRAVTTTGTATFDYPYAFNQFADAGPAQGSAAATQAFYITNQAHDVFYDLGFDELSRNGQNDNYGRGGLGNDALLVRVQDPSRTNNASMETNADGESGTMRLHLFLSPRASTLNVTTAFFPDGGLFAGAPNIIERESGWDVSGALMTVADADGGFGGCDPWADAGQYAGSVVLVRPIGCPLGDRIAHAMDAGAAALVLEGLCVGTVDQSMIITCVEPDAGQQLHDAVVSGQPITARLQRPPARPEFDVSFDSTVVTHEYMHLVTSRLIGDSMGLLNTPSRAMGEGWSDFAALYLSLRPDETMRAGNDQWQGSFAIGGWLMQGEDFDGALVPAHYFGVRRYPYSTDPTKNPLTFKHVGLNVPLPAVTLAPRQSLDPNNAQVHNAGEVWASILWDVQVRLLNAPGATFDGARVAMGRHLVAALKATAVLPTFIEARDAFLSVVFAASPTGDYPRALAAFAQRGLGVLAQSSDRRSTTNVPLAEDFTGAGGNYRLVSVVADDTDDDCDADGFIDSAETGTVTLTFMNVGSVRMTQSRLQVSSSLLNLQVSAALVNLPPSDPFTTTSVTIPVSMTRIAGVQRANLTIRVTDPQIILLQNAFETTASLRLNVDAIASDTEDFEQDVTDWVSDGDGFFPWEDFWVVRTVMMSQVLSGADPRAQGTSHVTSPPIAVGAGAFSVVFSNSYQFENALNFFDGGRVEVSTDGVTFTAVPGSALTPTYTGMLRAGTANPLAGQDAYAGSNTTRHDTTIDFGTQYANRTVWLRFVIGADVAQGAPGWIIDDVRVTGATMPPFTQIVGHQTLCMNHAPTVSGTSSINTAEREDVTLIPGTAFDQDQDPLTFTWMQTNGPSVQILGDTFVAPEVTPTGAVLGFRVTVSDGRGGTDTDDMTVTVRNVNRAPDIVSTNTPLEVVGGDRVTFSAVAEDPDGDAVTFQWMEEGASTITLENPNSDTVTFTAPNVKVAEQLSFRVVALDGAKASEPVFIGLVVRPKPDPCGCTSINAALGVLGLLLLARRRRR